MSRDSWKELFEAAGMLAIIASLVFVGYQLRQDELIARTALTSHTFEMGTAINLKMSDPELSSIYAKVLDSSEPLSTEEMVKFSSFLHSITDLFIRECHFVYRGMYDECSGLILSYTSRYFGNSFAQSWWKLNKPQSDDPAFALPDWVDSEIANLGSESGKRAFEEIKSNMQ